MAVEKHASNTEMLLLNTKMSNVHEVSSILGDLSYIW